jgi:hypothetical protein
MDPALRRAWTEIVTADDYEQHMAAIGQAQAAAGLTRWLVESCRLPKGARIMIAGAGTGQLFDFLDPAFFQPFRLTCSDLNPDFLARLRRRLPVDAVADDLERTSLSVRPALLLATLLLEHIDWRRGVQAIAGLQPACCGIVMQENPPGMASAVTPGRVVPPTIAEALSAAHIELVPQIDLKARFATLGYRCSKIQSCEVGDGKHLIGLLFVRAAGPVSL